MKRIETAVTSFREAGKDEALMTLADKNLLKSEAKEVLESAERVKENRKDLESYPLYYRTLSTNVHPMRYRKGLHRMKL